MLFHHKGMPVFDVPRFMHLSQGSLGTMMWCFLGFLSFSLTLAHCHEVLTTTAKILYPGVIKQVLYVTTRNIFEVYIQYNFNWNTFSIWWLLSSPGIMGWICSSVLSMHTEKSQLKLTYCVLHTYYSLHTLLFTYYIIWKLPILVLSYSCCTNWV